MNTQFVRMTDNFEIFGLLVQNGYKQMISDVMSEKRIEIKHLESVNKLRVFVGKRDNFGEEAFLV